MGLILGMVRLAAHLKCGRSLGLILVMVRLAAHLKCGHGFDSWYGQVSCSSQVW